MHFFPTLKKLNCYHYRDHSLLTIFFSLLVNHAFIWQPVFATVTIYSGNEQEVLAGLASQPLVFQVTDDLGNPTSGAFVNFSVIDPTGKASVDRLTHTSDQAGSDGQVTTELKATSTTGEYIITAILATDPSQSISALVKVIPPTPANILIVSGAGQQIQVGTQSQEIVFKVLDEIGTPMTAVEVNFSLINPSGSPVNALSTTNASTDGNGLVAARMKTVNKIGNYTMTAVITSDISLYVKTNILVVAGAPAKLAILSGENQTIFANEASNKILFKLTDAFNNALAGKTIDFSLITPSGQNSPNGIEPNQAITDINGQVATHLLATQNQGNYTLTATLASDQTITLSTNIQVAPPLPKLPSLGFGGAINPLGEAVATTAIFHGGITINGGAFEPEMLLTQQDSVEVKAFIQVDPNHIGQIADIVVVVGYKPQFQEPEVFFMLDTTGAGEIWDGDMAKLIPFQDNITLSEIKDVTIYQGSLSPGEIRVFLGYRLTSGLLVFNAEQSINMIIY
jgi:hypothetical protein